jgi:hypothetical protein
MCYYKLTRSAIAIYLLPFLGRYHYYIIYGNNTAPGVENQAAAADASHQAIVSMFAWRCRALQKNLSSLGTRIIANCFFLYE